MDDPDDTDGQEVPPSSEGQWAEDPFKAASYRAGYAAWPDGRYEGRWQGSAWLQGWDRARRDDQADEDRDESRNAPQSEVESSLPGFAPEDPASSSETKRLRVVTDLNIYSSGQTLFFLGRAKPSTDDPSPDIEPFLRELMSLVQRHGLD